MSNEKVDLFMPFFVGDYQKDTTDLTTEEHGAYFLLLLDLWNRGGYLPGDATRVARIARVGDDRWPSVWGTIGRFFTDAGDGRLTQKRLLVEFNKAKEKRRAASESGKKGAAAKHGKASGDPSGDPMTRPVTTVVAEPWRNGGSPSPSSQIQETLPAPARDPRPPAPALAPVPQEPEAITEVTGHDLYRWFGLARQKAFPLAKAWDAPPDRTGKASTFAASLSTESFADIRPTMLAAWRHIKARSSGWDKAELGQIAFAFGTWMARFTELREELAAPPKPVTSAPAWKGHTCNFHNDPRNGERFRPSSEGGHEDRCHVCRHVKAKHSDRRGEPTSVADLMKPPVAKGA